MGEVDVIIGIRIKHKSNRIAISQSYYIGKVLKKFNYFDCTPVSTHMDTSEKLMPNNGHAISQPKYSWVIRCLMYDMTCIRPDIAFVVGKLSRYTSNPVLEGYTDASWINNTEDNSSTNGWVFMLGGANTGKEAEWLRNLILKIPLWSKPIVPISILCDSVATLENAYSQMYNGKSRHLGVKHSMIREVIMNGVNRNSSSPKRIHFINTITNINKEEEPEEGEIIEPNAIKNNNHSTIKMKEKEGEGKSRDLKQDDPDNRAHSNTKEVDEVDESEESEEVEEEVDKEEDDDPE
nr:hypothetical protein [Tanacetum cinerariifolium]